MSRHTEIFIIELKFYNGRYQEVRKSSTANLGEKWHCREGIVESISTGIFPDIKGEENIVIEKMKERGNRMGRQVPMSLGIDMLQINKIWWHQMRTTDRRRPQKTIKDHKRQQRTTKDKKRLQKAANDNKWQQKTPTGNKREQKTTKDNNRQQQRTRDNNAFKRSKPSPYLKTYCIWFM